VARTVVVLGPRQRFMIGTLLIAAALALGYWGSLVEAALLLGTVVRSLLPVERGRPTDSIKIVKRGTRSHAHLRGKPPTPPDEPASPPTPPEEPPK
jgi:hypothetical protein